MKEKKRCCRWTSSQAKLAYCAKTRKNQNGCLESVPVTVREVSTNESDGEFSKLFWFQRRRSVWTLLIFCQSWDSNKVLTKNNHAGKEDYRRWLQRLPLFTYDDEGVIEMSCCGLNVACGTVRFWVVPHSPQRYYPNGNVSISVMLLNSPSIHHMREEDVGCASR